MHVFCASADPFPGAELPEEGLARPVVAGVVATICFLAAAVLFSTLAACFVNKQHRRKLKRKPGWPLTCIYTCSNCLCQTGKLLSDMCHNTHYYYFSTKTHRQQVDILHHNFMCPDLSVMNVSEPSIFLCI